MGYENAGEDRITVQGVADCVFWEEDGAVIVDYKTDRVSCAEELGGQVPRTAPDIPADFAAKPANQR